MIDADRQRILIKVGTGSAGPSPYPCEPLNSNRMSAWALRLLPKRIWRGFQSSLRVFLP
jgi:hypothetical protein